MGTVHLSWKDVNLKVLEGNLGDVKAGFTKGEISREVLKNAAANLTSKSADAQAFRDWLAAEVFVDRSVPPKVGETRILKSRAEQQPGDKGTTRPLDTPFVQVELNTLGITGRQEEVKTIFGDGYILMTRVGQKAIVTVETFEDPPAELASAPEATQAAGAAE
jgi:hypothetical protein